MKIAQQKSLPCIIQVSTNFIGGENWLILSSNIEHVLFSPIKSTSFVYRLTDFVNVTVVFVFKRKINIHFSCLFGYLFHNVYFYSLGAEKNSA